MTWVDDHCASFAKTVVDSVGFKDFDTSQWVPFDPFLFFPYIADLWINDILAAKKSFQEKGISIRDAADTFLGPQILRLEFLGYLFLDIKTADMIGTQDGNDLIEFVGGLVHAKCTDDPLGFSTSRVHTDTDIRGIYKTVPFIDSGEKDGRLVGNLINAGMQMAYAFFSDYCYMQWYDNFGPYNTEENGQKRQLVIRRYRNFQPTDVWPDAESVLFDDIVLYTEYADTDIAFDQWGHQQSSKPLSQHLTRFAISVDGAFVHDRERIQSMIETMARVSAKQHTIFTNLDFEEKKEKIIDFRRYCLKDFFALAGMDWHTTAAMRERIRGVQLLPDAYPSFQTREQALAWWASFVDPRKQVAYPSIWITPWKR